MARFPRGFIVSPTNNQSKWLGGAVGCRRLDRDSIKASWRRNSTGIQTSWIPSVTVVVPTAEYSYFLYCNSKEFSMIWYNLHIFEYNIWVYEYIPQYCLAHTNETWDSIFGCIRLKVWDHGLRLPNIETWIEGAGEREREIPQYLTRSREASWFDEAFPCPFTLPMPLCFLKLIFWSQNGR